MNNTKTNNLRKMGGVTALLASTLAFANSVEAINLIGNYTPPPNDQAGSGIDSIFSQRAVGFTLPALPAGTTGYRLDSIVLRLQNYITPTDTALLQIYADPTGTSTSNRPLVQNLQSVLFAANTPSGSNTAGNFSFTPNSPFTFAANTRYWLLVDATAGNYTWRSNNTGITPAGVATFISPAGYQISNDNGVNYASSTVFNSFNINATAVPFEFEATGGLVMLGGAWLLHKHLQKKKT